ncbi:MAG TPA: class A beta-lactamase [Candidatus Baltobacteraceae bacterium]|nr:class A beta-lactamase [Candidatus Baltobacteraceae bacterium]
MRRAAFLGGTAASLSLTFASKAFADDATPEFERIERSTGGRLGVAAIDTGNGRSIAYRARERFPMCSTFKVLAVSAVLTRADRGQERLTRHVRYGKRDLLEWAPITTKHVAQGFMSISDLCAAAIEYSDNTAANLLLETLGGPAAVTAYARSLGDSLTRLDRTEPALNTGIPGDVRDTTTPAAMLQDLQCILTGNVLSSQSRSKLEAWLVADTTGTNLLRAGFPRAWRAGDKTGLGGPHNRTGESSTRNDVAIAWPPNGAPILIAAYLTGSQVDAARRDGALAAIGHHVANSGM